MTGAAGTVSLSAASRNSGEEIGGMPSNWASSNGTLSVPCFSTIRPIGSPVIEEDAMESAPTESRSRKSSAGLDP